MAKRNADGEPLPSTADPSVFELLADAERTLRTTPLVPESHRKLAEVLSLAQTMAELLGAKCPVSAPGCLGTSDGRQTSAYWNARPAVVQEIRAAYSHRPLGEFIGIPWDNWRRLKEALHVASVSSTASPNDKYPDAIFVPAKATDPQRSSLSVVCQGWFFYPVIKG